MKGCIGYIYDYDIIDMSMADADSDVYKAWRQDYVLILYKGFSSNVVGSALPY